MIFLELFLTFFQIGLFTIGGGYAMIPLIREKVLENGWLLEEELINMIAVSESTPGPIAVNMATFVGKEQGGILGSFFATLGVVLPSFIIILLICSLAKNLMKYKGVKAFFSGVRPCVVALILSTSITLALSIFAQISSVSDKIVIDPRAICIFVIIYALSILYKALKNKKPSPILMIFISAVFGMVFYSI